MVNLMRRHAKTLFAIVTAIIAVSFLMWGPGMITRSGGDVRRLLGGRFSAGEIGIAQKAITMFNMLSGGRQNASSEQMANEVAVRVSQVREARAMGLRASDDDVAKAEVELFQIPPKQGEEPAIYQQRLQSHRGEMMQQLAINGITAGDFDRIMRDELLVVQLQNLVLSATKVTPAEVRQWWEVAHEKVTVILVRFKLSDYRAQVNVTDDEVKKFYESNPAPFAIPEKVKVRYARLELEPVKKEVAVTDEELRAGYERNKARFLDEKGQPKPFDAVRADLENSLRTYKAKQELGRRAQMMLKEIFPPTENIKPVPFTAAAAARKLTVSETDFFAQNEPIAGVQAGASFNNEAFKLREADFRVGNPIGGEDGVYLMEIVARQPRNEKPDFALVKDKVLAAYREVHAYQLAQKSGREAQAKILEAARKGEPFAKAASAQGAPAVTLPIFAAVDPLPDVPDADRIKFTALGLNVGETSDFVPSADGGFILHLEARAPGDDELFRKESADTAKGLANMKRQLAIQEWFSQLARGNGVAER